MIIRPKPTLWDVLFTLKGSIAKHIAIRLLAITVLACCVTILSLRHPELFERFGAAPFKLIGLSLSIFMSFRNNACYERWWEGRKQWGQLIVEVRSFLRESREVGDDLARCARFAASSTRWPRACVTGTNATPRRAGCRLASIFAGVQRDRCDPR